MNLNYFNFAKKSLVSLLCAGLGLSVGANLGLVKADVNSPSFPSCTQLIFSQQGDWTHWDTGLHGIPGVGTFEGSDDVYSQAACNFVQCFCPKDGDSGIQTNWWNIDGLSFSEEDENELTGRGFIFERGSVWNLFDKDYLAKNSNFSCKKEEPTPTPTPTSTPTLTVTPTPTPTSTPTSAQPESRCVSLSASPTEGTKPLTVKLTGSGFDSDGNIQRYKFDFGDASGGQPQIWEQDSSEAAHRYENSGTFVASLQVKDSRGDWRDGSGDCKRTITVKETPKVLGAQLPPQLPTTGYDAFVGLGLIPAAVYLYKRFKLI